VSSGGIDDQAYDEGDLRCPALTVERAEDTDASEVEALLDTAAKWQQSRGIQMWTPGWFRDEV
jgi:hypothetical protein